MEPLPTFTVDGMQNCKVPDDHMVMHMHTSRFLARQKVFLKKEKIWIKMGKILKEASRITSDQSVLNSAPKWRVM